MRTLLLLALFFLQTAVLMAQKEIEYRQGRYERGIWGKVPKKYYSLEIYNADNLLIEKRSSGTNDSNYSRTVYEYNTNGQKISETDFLFGHQIVKRTYTYDENGWLKTMAFPHRNKEGEWGESKEEYSYDLVGTLTMRTRTSTIFKQKEAWTYTYETVDGIKKVTELYSGYNSKKKTKKITLYNTQGLIAVVTENNVRTEYEYLLFNEAGEWTKRKVCIKEGTLGVWKCYGEYRSVRLK
jgi:hypothetical protein